jgi:hypothetical protein
MPNVDDCTPETYHQYLTVDDGDVITMATLSRMRGRNISEHFDLLFHLSRAFRVELYRPLKRKGLYCDAEADWEEHGLFDLSKEVSALVVASVYKYGRPQVHGSHRQILGVQPYSYRTSCHLSTYPSRPASDESVNG